MAASTRWDFYFLGAPMNTDIRLAVTFFTHPKTQKLKRRLGSDGVVALLTLWVSAAQNRADGNLYRMDDEDIELSAGWAGESGALVAVLVALRFLDSTPDGYVLHDWLENNPWVADAPARSERARKGGLAKSRKMRELAELDAAPGITGFCLEQDNSCLEQKPALLNSTPGVLAADFSAAPILTLPNQNQTIKPLPGFSTGICPDHVSPSVDEGEAVVDVSCFRTRRGRKLSGRRLETFLVFWDAFAYKSGKSDAADAWMDIPSLNKGLVDEIVAAASIEAKNRGDMVAAGKTPKMPQGWLSSRRWEDEGIQSVPGAAAGGETSEDRYRKMGLIL